MVATEESDKAWKLRLYVSDDRDHHNWYPSIGNQDERHNTVESYKTLPNIPDYARQVSHGSVYLQNLAANVALKIATDDKNAQIATYQVPIPETGFRDYMEKVYA